MIAGISVSLTGIFMAIGAFCALECADACYLSRLRGPGEVHKVMRNDGVVVD